MKGDDDMFGKKNMNQAVEMLELQYKEAVEAGDLEKSNDILKQLNSIKGEKKKLNPNDVLKVVAGLAGTVTVLLWEERHVIGSKVFGNVFKNLFQEEASASSFCLEKEC